MYNAAKETNVQVSKDIYPNEAWELILKTKEGEGIVILDISTPKEYQDLHLEAAVNLNLLSRFFKARLDIMDKTKTYIVYCKVGGRSKFAQKLMRRMGFQRIYNIIGGTLLWEEEGLPFASDTAGVNKFSFCPFFITILTFKKVKKALQIVLSRVVPQKSVAISSGLES